MRRTTFAAIAIAAVAGAAITGCSSSAASANPVSGSTVAAVHASQPRPTVIQCQVSNPKHPTTLFLGYPSTHGHLFEMKCNMSLRGNVVTLTLPGTKAHASYGLLTFNPVQKPEAPLPFPKLTGNLAVTLTFVNGTPDLKAGGHDHLVGADIEIPKYLGPVLIVRAGNHVVKLTLYPLG